MIALQESSKDQSSADRMVVVHHVNRVTHLCRAMAGAGSFPPQRSFWQKRQTHHGLQMPAPDALASKPNTLLLQGPGVQIIGRCLHWA